MSYTKSVFDGAKTEAGPTRDGTPNAVRVERSAVAEGLDGD